MILMFFAGCVKSEDDPSFIYNLDEEFEIRPVEQLSRNGSKLNLEISSLLPASCDNSEILYQYRHEKGVSTIKINDITGSNNCLVTDTSPSVNVTLTNIGHKTRNVNITIKDIIENEGRIEEFEDRYEIQMNATDGIRINQRELYKIQPSMIWGGADYENDLSADVADTFISDLAQLTLAKSLTVGYYGHFQMMPNDEIVLWTDTYTLGQRSAFAFGAKGTLSDLRDLIEEYRIRYPEIRFFVYNAFGESL